MQSHYQIFLGELASTTSRKIIGASFFEEQAWCRWYAREIYRGEGALVEWGPCLGALTEAYCEGLAKNPSINGKKKFVHVYDLFDWNPIYESWFAGTPHVQRLKPGENYRDYFRELHRGYEDFFEIHQADLTHERWPGLPIEWIINDAVKSLEIGNNLFNGWIPSMMPGCSRIAHQDYLWSNNSFVQVYMYLLRENFEYEYSIPNSCMAIFKNVKQCDPAPLAKRELNGNTVTGELINETFDWSATVLTDVNPKLLALCRSATLRDFGHLEAARKIARDNQLTSPANDWLIDYQRNILLGWGYADILTDAGS